MSKNVSKIENSKENKGYLSNNGFKSIYMHVRMSEKRSNIGGNVKRHTCTIIWSTVEAETVIIETSRKPVNGHQSNNVKGKDMYITGMKI